MAEESRRLRDTVIALTQEIGPRAPGSFAERRAAEYLLGRFQELGIEAQIEPFESASHKAERARLLLAKSKQEFECLPSQFSASGEVEGKIVFVGDCDLVLKEEDVFSGSIGLLLRSGDHAKRIRFLLELEKRGMAGVIVISPQLDTIETKLLRYPEVKMPIVSVSFRTATELKRHEGDKVVLSVEGSTKERHESQNVVGTIRGDGDNWLVVSSHYDSAAFSPGASDDASGTAVVLELARRLKQGKRPATILLVLTGSEEYGENDGTARGALAFYRRRENDLSTCIGHVDTDDLGNTFSIPHLYLSGPRTFRDTVVDDHLRRKFRVKGRSGGGCDHGAAERNGIPYVWFTDIASGNNPQLHSPEDKIDFLNFDRMATFLDDIEGAVERLSKIEPVFPFVRDGGIVIRPARSVDIPSIFQITQSAFGPVTMARIRQEFFQEKLAGKEWHEHKNAQVETACRNCLLQTVIAEVDGAVVGYATYSLDEEAGVASIGNNAVHPDHQGQGIGTRLQKEVDRRMREEGYTKFTVSTLANDAAAQRVYEKMGYTKVMESYHYLKKTGASVDSVAI